MRIPEYLSPTSIGLYQQNPEDFYIRYMSPIRVPRDPQTQPMSIGSAFDAMVKSSLYADLYGKGHNPDYELKALFEKQVEPHNRDWAWPNGIYAFRCYKDSGAYTDILKELEQSVGTPRFEFEIRGPVATEAGSVIFLGKPDVHYINKEGYSVVKDWKVNGYCSTYKQSPKKGYLKLLPEGKVHKDANPISFQGTIVNGKFYLEDVAKDWAAQLAIYAWLLGENVGSQFVVGLDQLVCNPTGGMPEITIAQHRLRVGEQFQKTLFTETLEMWTAINSDHIFRDCSKEESQKRCVALNKKAEILNDDDFRGLL